MRNLREALASVWATVNPAEPGPGYLTTFLSIAALLIVVALLIGQP